VVTLFEELEEFVGNHRSHGVLTHHTFCSPQFRGIPT
jgi:hypothetical protein